MTKIKALTFREKQLVLEKIFSQYRRAKIKLHCLNQTSFYPAIHYDLVREKGNHYSVSMMDKLNEHIDNKDELESIIITFECIVSTLSTETKRIIMNEFVEPLDEGWWYEYYSKSTYYRVKSRAMEEALFYLNI
ncbi:MG284/MPN403 family protein [Tannockella kyphosi]|uniref:MG284/MPN403 family protein n=1 Tax=Tannockella kyphosi TaxID=2899121 RepID=UPI0020117C8F|nr:hypothetical protein [Tannockella kyphosi]